MTANRILGAFLRLTSKRRQTLALVDPHANDGARITTSRALPRLDALTNWERRPRGTMRVGLEPMLYLAARRAASVAPIDWR
jgi:hypothetical protein